MLETPHERNLGGVEVRSTLPTLLSILNRAFVCALIKTREFVKASISRVWTAASSWLWLSRKRRETRVVSGLCRGGGVRNGRERGKRERGKREREEKERETKEPMVYQVIVRDVLLYGLLAADSARRELGGVAASAGLVCLRW